MNKVRIYQIISVFMLTISAQSVYADVLDCHTFEAQNTLSFNTQSAYVLDKDRVVTFAICGEDAGSGRYTYGMYASVWESGEKVVEQRLDAGIVDGPPTLKITKNKITATYTYYDRYAESSKDAVSTQSKVWTYKPKAHILALNDKSATLTQQVKLYSNALNAREPFKALDILEQNFTSTLDPARNPRFYAHNYGDVLNAGHQKALALYKKKDLVGAAKISRQLLERMDKYTIYTRQDEASSLWAFQPWINPTSKNYILLPKSPENAQYLNDLAFFLAESKQADDLKLAIFIYEQLKRHYRSRTVLYLNLGDAYWDLNALEPFENQRPWYAPYKKYQTLSSSKSIPERVLQRIEK